MAQGRFEAMGENLFIIMDKLVKNQRLCRLLHYSSKTPFEVTEQQPDIEGTDLVHKNILIVPKPPDEIITQESFIVALLNNFYLDTENNDFKVSAIKFNIMCPFDDWVMSASAPRPYMIMQEVDKMFNGERLKGIGTLRFVAAQPLIVSPQLGGYSMEYTTYDFN